MTTPDPVTALGGFAAFVAAGLVLGWPRHGVIPRLLKLARLGERVRLEDALKHVYTCERRGTVCSLESMAGRLEVSVARAATLLSRLAAMGVVRMDDRGPALTPDGRRSAVRLVRTHRLWERYLADRTGVPAGEWHDRAEVMEHALSVEKVDTLDAQLGHPPWDPHGDPIPTSTGEIPPVQGLGLIAAPTGSIVEIVHVEDEPREIYSTLLEDGLALGCRLEVVDRIGRGVRVRAGGRTWIVESVAAANVTVRVLPAGERPDAPHATLLDVPPHQTALVVGLVSSCRGPQRRRLLDLGFVRGAHITPELVSAAGDPIAYRIRGAVIGLRRGQAAQVLVDRLQTSAAVIT